VVPAVPRHTGRVVGGEAGANIAAKQNGIGSKNFGLR
jgi:hypothetical protein